MKNSMSYIKKIIKEYYLSYADLLGLPSFADQYVSAQIENKLPKYIINDIFRRYQCDLENVLDMGCGLGGFITECHSNQINCIGIDVDERAVYITQERLKLEGKSSNSKIICASAEALPFNDNSFSTILSMTVVEHVKNIYTYLKEANRVLKSGGILIVVAPNYNSFWEGHYRVMTLPYVMRYFPWLFRIYLKLRGRNVKYCEMLNFSITPSYLVKMLNKSGFSIIANESVRKIERNLTDPTSLVDAKMEYLVKNLHRIFRAQLFKDAFVNVLNLLKIYHPIVLVCRKSLK